MSKRTAIGEIIKVLNQRDQRNTVGSVSKSEKSPTTWIDPLKHAANHQAGGSDIISIDDTMIGDRTATDTSVPTGDTGKLQDLFSWLAYMIKAITGKTSWRTSPAISLESTYEHVDNENIHVHAPCKAATTGDNALTGEQTIDGVTCVSGDRVLVYKQTSGISNGIYVVALGTWSRAIDMDEATDLSSGITVWVSQGTSNAKTLFTLTNVDPMVLDTTPLTFEKNAASPSSSVTADEVTITGDGTAGNPLAVKDSGISLVKMTNVASGTVFYRKSAGTGSPEVQTLATLAADLGITGGGSVWYDGSGVPSDGTGADGDYYLNDTNGDVYNKTGGSWGTPIANIKGADGAEGAAGAPGTPGTNGVDGVIGDYAENSGSHSGLNFAYNAGKVRENNVIQTTTAGSIALTDNTINYIEVSTSTGIVTANTTGFTSDLTPLFTVVTSGAVITTVTDCRCFFKSGGTGIAWFSSMILPTITDATTGLAITTITKP